MGGRPVYRKPALLLFLLVFGAGCATPVAYLPNIAAFDELGLSEVKSRVSEALGRAVAPPINSIDVSDHALSFRWTELIYGAYGIPMGVAPRDALVLFGNVSEIQIYSNHWVFIWGYPGKIMVKVLFQNHNDARGFADLVMSLRERRLRAGAATR